MLSSLPLMAEDQGEELKLCGHRTQTRRELWYEKTPLASVADGEEPWNIMTTKDSKTGARRKRTLADAGHSVVEKRYRTKLNDELGRLRDTIPSLRIIPKKFEEYAYREGTEMLDRPQAYKKLDRTTIISRQSNTSITLRCATST